ncbi:SDR family oxidoreductase [Microbacterium sp. SS28]|uniref:SDR family oxidoreductase n=1 Tax=Microbacterium sp. SS28 TaxID=2919948 RepID=UPI001FAAB76D|nr:NAD(P)H-binding protein [Microbacterium sp. SS28]
MRIAVAGGTGQAGAAAVAAARERGHEVVVLARSAGVDLVRGTGVAAALEGVEVVVDASGVQGKDDPTAFHEAVTRSLTTEGQRAGVRHVVVLSIVGCDRVHGFALYAGKVAQERATARGGIPFTIARATQFHEFSRQVFGFAKAGPVHFAPSGRLQPVAVREVGARLVDLAEAAPVGGRAADFAGPREESLRTMVRAYAKAAGERGVVLPLRVPGGLGRAQRDGSLLPGPDAVRGAQTFSEWIAALPAKA